jgi:hypothetical protein
MPCLCAGRTCWPLWRVPFIAGGLRGSCIPAIPLATAALRLVTPPGPHPVPCPPRLGPTLPAGIIDILTPFNARKAAEWLLKRMSFSAPSAVPPDQYAERFKAFLQRIFT